jgi:UDP-N-acetylglucosamine--N-acetylmuramyl-(pentapeptide) pyrophosphoryl-undecaprenol N-acetylglucosamine transferase
MNPEPPKPAPRLLRIALACGGTGGHIFPGIATADVLRERGHTVTLWMAGKDVESAAVKDWPGAIVTIPARGLPSGLSPRLLAALWSLLRAMHICRQKMRQAPPDVLLAMGSYASIGPGWAALRNHVPLVLHEANVVPGRAIRLLSRWATSVAASFEASRYYLQHTALTVTGMPIRRDLERASRTVQRASGADVPRVMVLGGSRGAHSLNEVVVEAFALLQARGVPVHPIHLTGPTDEPRVRAAYARHGISATVHGFTTDMAPLYAAADLAVSRSGASTCAELLAFGVPALFVPYPYAAADHQLANAKAMARLGAADYVSEDNLSAAWLADYLTERCRNRVKLAAMSTAGRAHRECCGAEALADLVERVGRAKTNGSEKEKR